MSGNNWQNWQHQPPQQPQHPQHPQQDMYQQSQQGYGYNQQARVPQQPMRPTDYGAYQQQQQQRQQVHPSAYGRQPQQPSHYQQNYMGQQQQHHGYHSQQPFMFNANANIFVPRNQMMAAPRQDYGYYSCPPYQQQQSHHYQQQNQYGATSAPSSSYNAMYQQEDASIDAFAQFGQQSQQYLPSRELSDQIQHSKCSAFLTEILVGCEQLIAEGEEDSPTWISAIRQRFEDPNMDDEAKKTGVKLIIEMAYSMESNQNQFRSIDPQNTFSNLLKTLSIELKDFLRKFIVPALGEYHDSRKSLENDARVYMAVFYAEVYVKLFLENGSRFEKIGEALADQIDEILKFQPKDEYMKCLLRAFKVAGAEMDCSEALRRRVDQILTIMGGYAKGSPLLGESVKARISLLIECRQRGWDRSATRGPEMAAHVSNRENDSYDESTDNDLTEEERQFLESHLDQVESGRGGDDDIDDQEMMKEFGKFVKEELQQAEELKTAEMLQNCNINKDEEDEKTPTEEKQ